MENKEVEAKKDRTVPVRTFMYALCLIFIVLLVYIVGGLILTKNNYGDTSESDAFFPGCSLKDKECNDSDCNMYLWCGDGDHSLCRIYDCDKEYGIFTKDTEGNIETRREAKPDTSAIAEKTEACGGTYSVLNQSCTEENLLQATVNIVTKGQCEIEIVMLKLKGDENLQASQFELPADGNYQITGYSCGEIEQVVPSAKGGIVMDFLTKE